MRSAALLALAITLCGPVESAAQDEFFTAGNDLYQAGDYEGALENYGRIVDAGYGSAALYYNIGNSYFKLGDLGRSILHYERAALLDPSNEDVRANLALARSLTVDEIDPLPTFWLVRVAGWWVGLMPFWLLQLVVAGAYLAGLGALTLLILRRTDSRGHLLRNAMVAASVVAVVFGVNLFVRELGVGRNPTAIVMEPEVAVYSAPADDRSLIVFNVHEGTRVRIDQESGEWAEVVLADGNVGWLKIEAVEPI